MKVIVGLSGGVDSSVTALLLKKAGYDVVGMFMQNWEENDEFGVCSAKQDFEDVKRVANKIGIPYFSVNYSKEYLQRVFDYFIKEYQMGFTPNPDVMCNREIKFGPFLERALMMGTDLIATGHYCKRVERDGKFYLYKPKDLSKDQTYFLCEISQAQLSKVIFPLQDLLKTEVRKIASENGLVTANKKDSTGICFIGERNFRKFLKEYIPAKPGLIVDTKGNVLGEHDGCVYYTIGQRKGLNIGGKSGYAQRRWYVVDKDVKTNKLIVSCGEGSELFSKFVEVSDFNWITDVINSPFDAFAKLRYREPDKPCKVTFNNGKMILEFDSPERAVTKGQFAVLYAEDGMCYGGGKITNYWK